MGHIGKEHFDALLIILIRIFELLEDALTLVLHLLRFPEIGTLPRLALLRIGNIVFDLLKRLA